MQTERNSTPKRGRLSRIPRRVKWLIYVVYLLVLSFLGIELFWWLRFDTPSGDQTEAVWQMHFDELWRSGVIHAEPSTDDDTIDILLLGGSVLEQTAPLWETALTERTGRPVRVYNLARSAHTSRDSRIKFSRLAGRPFDWVVIYHGINDVRMNYATDESFRDDYTHCVWYASFEKRVKAGRVTIADVTLDVADSLTALGTPPLEMYPHGRKLRTPGPFGDNLSAITAQATESGSRVMLMTFAWHLPDNYTRDRFLNGELDYGDGHYHMPAEDWGEPSQVPVLLQAHNEETRRIAAGHSGNSQVVCIDLADLLEPEAVNFSDICHLTADGCRTFVEHAVDKIARAGRDEAP